MGREGVFSLLNDDVLQNILGRLPALSFASAACVNKSWNHVCNRILSRPKLASALSLNPSLQGAVKEVFDKVLSQPIRPHFAIAFVGMLFKLEVIHRLIKEKLGSKTPVITNTASGIIGIDALTDEIREVKWEIVFEDDDEFVKHEYNFPDNVNRGIVLVVGFVPGLKVETIPLLRPKQEPEEAMVDKFVMDIRNYTASVSGCKSPASIMIFGDQKVDMKPIMAKIDYALAAETMIAGYAGGRFLCTSRDNSKNYSRDLYFFDAVALTFARDREKSHGIGETQFHVTLSSGIIPFGPKLKALSVGTKDSECSWLSVLVEEHDLMIIDGQSLIDEINKELDYPDLYIGVTQRRECSIGSEKSSQATSLTFYEVLGGENGYIVVDGVGIKPGDVFLFYHSDSEIASASCAVALDNLGTLRADSNSIDTRHQNKGVAGHQNFKREVFGGFNFTCFSRGASFFRHPNVDSAPFVLNFPGVPLAGVFCSGEIGRESMDEEEEEGTPRCCLHFYGTVYLAMSYVPAPPQLR